MILNTDHFESAAAAARSLRGLRFMPVGGTGFRCRKTGECVPPQWLRDDPMNTGMARDEAWITECNGAGGYIVTRIIGGMIKE